MASKRRDRSRGRHQGNNLADMSLPPELRHRRSGGRARTPVPAQEQHASSPRARRKARGGERKMRRAR